MTLEKASWYRSRECIVCGRHTRDLVAPLGIVSGSFPCHVVHSDREIREAWIQLVDKITQRWSQEELEQGGM